MEIGFGGCFMVYLAREECETFQGERKDAKFLVDLIVSKISIWATREFIDYDVETLCDHGRRSWRVVAFSLVTLFLGVHPFTIVETEF